MEPHKRLTNSTLKIHGAESNSHPMLVNKVQQFATVNLELRLILQFTAERGSLRIFVQSTTRSRNNRDGFAQDFDG